MRTDSTRLALSLLQVGLRHWLSRLLSYAELYIATPLRSMVSGQLWRRTLAGCLETNPIVSQFVCTSMQTNECVLRVHFTGLRKTCFFQKKQPTWVFLL